MIDINAETLIPLKQALEMVPRTKGWKGKLTTVHRWINEGCRGIRLEAVVLGGRTYTSKEAMQRWADKLTAARKNRPDNLRKKKRTAA